MESHLLQMRGLKPGIASMHLEIDGVASFTDAWIETIIECNSCIFAESHLLQMRGLKQDTTLEKEEKKKSHLLQMRGLKPNNADKH